MKIAVLSPFSVEVPRGNSVAARRLIGGLLKSGHEAFSISPADALKIENSSAGKFADLALALHACHCARAVEQFKKIGIPTVLSLRGTDADIMLDDPEKSQVIDKTMRCADLLCVFSEEIRDSLALRLKIAREKFRIVPNGLEIGASNIDFREKLAIPKESFVFLSVAGLRSVKRPLFPALLLETLRKKRPEIFFLHAGPVIEDEVGKEFFDFVSVCGWTMHAGLVEHGEMDSFLRAGDVFVSASISEGMPHAVREAMFQGLPCLLSDIAGHRRLASPELEALFFKNEDEFIRNSARLLENAHLRNTLGAGASGRVKRDMAASDETKAYINIFKELLEK